MPTSGRVRSRRRSTSKPSYLWQSASIDPTAISAGNLSHVNLLPLVTPEVLGVATITRIRGVVAYKPGSQGVDYGVHAAIYVATEDALTAGALLEPELDQGSFMWFDTAYFRVPELAIASGNVFIQREVDGKSQRRMVSSENRLIFTVENTLAGSVDYAFMLRVLLRLG